MRTAPAVIGTIGVALLTLSVACSNDGSAPTSEQRTGTATVHQTIQNPTEQAMGTTAPVSQETATAAPLDRVHMDETEYRAWTLTALERNLTITEEIGDLIKGIVDGEVSESFARSRIGELAREYQELAGAADAIDPPLGYEESREKLSQAFRTYTRAADLIAQQGVAATEEVDRLLNEASQLLSEGAGVPLPE